MKIVYTLTFLLFSSVLIGQNSREEVVVRALCQKRKMPDTINSTNLQKALAGTMNCGIVSAGAVGNFGEVSNPFKYIVSSCQPPTQPEQPAKPIVRLSCRSTMPDNCKPLWVVDGVIQDTASVSKINPNDIEHIEILKGATATAIFGIQGANGVILIRLKMKYDKISIKDVLDKTPITKATVSFVFPGRKDTLRYIADDSGVIVSNSLPKLEGCEMIVSATGYKTDTRTFQLNKADPLSEILLARDVKVCREVILSSIICRRKGCGWCWVHRRTKITEIPVKILAMNFKAYPNPSKHGEVINFQLTSVQDGSMNLRMISLDGKIMFEQSVKALKGSNNYRLRSGPDWAAGIYYIQLLYENGRTAASGKIVVQ